MKKIYISEGLIGLTHLESMMAKQRSGLSFRQIAWCFTLIKLGLHLFTFHNYELHRDEMLFFHQGSHVSFGNVSVPPFIGWVAFAVKSVFGHSVFGVRLVPMLLGSLSVLVIARLVKAFGGERMALTLACTAFVLSPGFLLFDSLFTVNVFDQFFWLVISYQVVRMVQTQDPGRWLRIGALSGLAFLNKYLVLYLLAGFVIALLCSPNWKLIFTRHFVYALCIGLLIISPNIFWQYAHGWPIFLQVSELEKTQMVNMTPFHFLVDLFNLNYIATFLWVGGMISVFVIRQEKQYRYMGVASLVIILLFMLSKGKAYYALGMIPVWYAWGGNVLEKYLTGRKVVINYVFLGLLLLCQLLAIPYALPLFPFEKLRAYSERTSAFVSYPFSRWEDGKIHHTSQVFSDMTGWKEMVSLVNKAYLKVPEKERANTTVFAERNYGYAGAVHFYGKEYDLPEPITFLESYVIWAPDSIPNGPLIYINYDLNGVNNLFGKWTHIGTVNNTYFREHGLKVYLFEQPNEKLQRMYREAVADEKKVFKRR